MKIIIINLTRMGDLIQTIGLINAINKRYPKATIDILVMKGFSKIVNHMSHINHIYCLDEGILNPNITHNKQIGIDEISSVIDSINKNNYDLLYNPIVSQQSALLAFLVEAKKKLGFLITKKKEQKITSDFISFQLANMHKIGDFSFNLVDIFAGMVSGSSPPYNISFKNPASLIKTEEYTIGFHIGASQSNKAWDIKYYHKVILELLKENKYQIILFGGYKEKDYKSYFDSIKHEKFHNTIGDYNIDELIEAIGKIDLMVTNDTGPMHIAVALDKPIIDISLGPVSKWETGPYNDKSIIIHSKLGCYPCDFNYNCKHWNCHHDITADIVLSAIKLIQQPDIELTSNYNSFLSKTYFDEFGFHSVKPIKDKELSVREVIFTIKRYIWSLYFTGNLDMEIAKKRFRKLNFKGKLALPELQELIEITSSLLSDLEKISNNKKNIDKNQSILQDVKRNKELLFSKASEFELIYDWFSFATYKESEIEDYELSKIVRKSISIYLVLRTKLMIFQELLP